MIDYNIDNLLLEQYIGFVYITINKLNGRSYIGQKHFNNNWESYLGSGKILKQAVNKYGEDAFYKVIVGFAKTDEELNKLEKDLITINNCSSNDIFYNIAEGGHGGNTFAGYTEDEFKQYCQSLCGENNPYYGKHHSDEVKAKMALKRKNRVYKPMSDEQKAILSQTKKQLYQDGLIKLPTSHIDIYFMDGTVQHFESLTEMLNNVKISKKDYYRIKRLDIPKFIKKEKQLFFSSIDRIVENNNVVYDRKNMYIQ